MKLWILGKNGLLGRSLCNLCIERKISFIATGRDDVDITDFSAIQEAFKKILPTHIINCSAYTDVDLAEKAVEQAFAVNAKGPENLGKINGSRGKVIHISTDYVFDGKKHSPYYEEDSCTPLSIYGKSKREGEIKLLEADPEALIIRTAWVFGKGGKNFISSLLDLIRNNEEIKTPSNQIGSPTFVNDLSVAILDLLNQKGIFHFVNEGEASRYEIAEHFFNLAKEKGLSIKCKTLIPMKFENMGFIAPRPSYSALDVTKVKGVLGFSPRAWKEAVKDYINEIT